MNSGNMSQALDIRYMRHALRLAAQGTGRTWPNPNVGCVIVQDGRIVGAARTADTGRPHAETEALAQAGIHAKGATAYVTLEPCAHMGKTGPCAEALIKAGIVRVVVAAQDRDARVAGKGIAILERAGITVARGVCEMEALAQHAAFFRRIDDGIPEVSMKLATSLDGAIADHEGTSKWITAEAARRHGHRIRGLHDAIITGIGTVLADDPVLTCRLPGLAAQSPVRVVLDTLLRTLLDAQLVTTADHFPTWIITTARGIEEQASHATELREHGVKLLVVDTDARITPLQALQLLAAEGITRVLVEAGPALSSAFVDAGVLSRLYWYRAPLLIPGGKQALSAQATASLANAYRFAHMSRMALDTDQLDIYEAACLPV